MTNDELYIITQIHREDLAERGYDCNKAVVLISYAAFKKLHNTMRTEVLFYFMENQHQPNPNAIMYGGVRISWTPMLTGDEYVKGLTE